MSQGDLIIIKDALKETIKRQTEVKLLTNETTGLYLRQHLEYIETTAKQLHTVGNKFTRIGELLVAIDDALRQDDSE